MSDTINARAIISFLAMQKDPEHIDKKNLIRYIAQFDQENQIVPKGAELTIFNHTGLLAQTVTAVVDDLEVMDDSKDKYKRDIQYFLAYLKENHITYPTKKDLRDYRNALQEKGYQPTTVKSYMAGAKIFLNWIADKGLYPRITDHVSVKTSNEKHKKALSAEQVARIIDELPEGTENELRDKAIFMMMVFGGFRSVEMSEANIEDIRYDQDFLVLYYRGKGGAEKLKEKRIVQETEEILRKYLTVREAGIRYQKVVSDMRKKKIPKEQIPEEIYQKILSEVEKESAEKPIYNIVGSSSFPLFGGRPTSKRMTPKTIGTKMTEILNSHGFDGKEYTAHSLRHTAASQAYEAGADPEAIQAFLGHQSIGTTYTYIRESNALHNPTADLIAEKIKKTRKSDA